MSDQIRIVVADGHTLTRFGLLGLVSAQPGLTIVGETVSDRRPLPWSPTPESSARPIAPRP